MTLTFNIQIWDGWISNRRWKMTLDGDLYIHFDLWPSIFRFGTVESAIGVGNMIGPTCSGLADVGGYFLPFLVVGLLPILPAAITTITMTTQTTSQSNQTVSIMALLRIPGVFIMSLATVIFTTPVMLQGTLAPHLKPFRLSHALLGCVFLIRPLCYAVSNPIVGKIAGRVKYKLLLMVFGAYGK